MWALLVVHKSLFKLWIFQDTLRSFCCKIHFFLVHRWIADCLPQGTSCQLLQRNGQKGIQCLDHRHCRKGHPNCQGHRQAKGHRGHHQDHVILHWHSSDILRITPSMVLLIAVVVHCKIRILGIRLNFVFDGKWQKWDRSWQQLVCCHRLQGWTCWKIWFLLFRATLNLNLTYRHRSCKLVSAIVFVI